VHSFGEFLQGMDVSTVLFLVSDDNSINFSSTSIESLKRF